MGLMCLLEVKMDKFTKLTIRIPKHIRDWLSKEAAENAGSMGSEIVRAVRERMERDVRKHQA
jgi:hypothetical protein